MTHVITGGAGFIGSWVVERLVADGASVVAVDNLATGRSENLESIRGPGSWELVRGDVRARDLLAQVVSPGDTVIHLAALVGVDRVCEDPRQTFDNNLEATRAVLDVALSRRCRVFVASSSEVYGDAGRRAVGEHEPPCARITSCGRGHYTLAKLAGEQLALLHHEVAGLEVVVGRVFNTIGPRQSSRYGMVVPRLLEQAVSGEPLTVMGDGTQVRSFCGVTDTVDAILRLCSTPRAMGQVLNIGGTEPVQIRTLAEYIRAETGSASPLEFVPRPPNRRVDVDVRYRRPNIDRINALTGWEPAIGWRDAVRELAARPPARERVPALS
jgi:nucleoside-diphosphate-sugar epimerase